MARRTRGTVRGPSAFWDASALVPLCVHQSLTARVTALYRSYELIVWWATPVEIASALARMLRVGDISTNDHAKARDFAERVAQTWSVMQPSEALRALALQLVERYDLRAADSLQLAAALEWCDALPSARKFFSADTKLQEAALLAGFDAQPI
ncbi:MAG TPA: type II toxin-antitoxin system VapC family toxin [Terriglobales bacterium]|nr:type II toxin-antitoxin system VapC family toxin [Terriglobales bacterium]